MSTDYAHIFPWQLITRSARLDLAVRLDFNVDVERLRQEAKAILQRFEPRPQHTVHHDGGWTAVGLVSVRGDMEEDRGSRTHDNYKPTPALESAPYIQEILDHFGASTGRVRLLSLTPGERVCWHWDGDDSIDTRFLRIHLPIWTNRGVKLQISHQDLFWRPGEVWYGEFSFPHRLRNDGEETRVHLVCDVKVNDVTRRLLPQWYLEQRDVRARWRRLAQHLCRAHQVAILRTSRTRTLLGGYAWARHHSAS